MKVQKMDIPWPSQGIESFPEGDEPPLMVGTEALGNGNDHFGIHEQNQFCKQRGCLLKKEIANGTK